MADPLLDAMLEPPEIEALTSEMLAVNAPFLPQFELSEEAIGAGRSPGRQRLIRSAWRRLAARSATGAPEHRACAKRYALSSARSGQVTPRPATSQAY